VPLCAPLREPLHTNKAFIVNAGVLAEHCNVAGRSDQSTVGERGVPSQQIYGVWVWPACGRPLLGDGFGRLRPVSI
jgi:hypothetical protein